MGDHLARQLAGEQPEVGTVARHHRALTGVIDEHRDRAGEVGIRLDEVARHVLDGEVLASELPHPVAADLADEVRLQPAARRPHGDVGGTPAGHQDHLAERVTTALQLGVGSDQHVPGEVADHAQVDVVGVHDRKRYPRRG